MWSPRQVTHLPLCGIFYFPWHRHQIEGTNGFYCLIRKTERFTISNVESQVFTPNNSRLDPGSNPGCPRDKRMVYHWTNCALLYNTLLLPHINYCILSWGYKCDRITNIQKRAISKCNAHTEPIFKQFKLLKVNHILQMQEFKFYPSSRTTHYLHIYNI